MGERQVHGSSCRGQSTLRSSALPSVLCSARDAWGRRTNVLRHCPVWASHKRIDLSLDPVATNAPGAFVRDSPPVFYRSVSKVISVGRRAGTNL